jgi:hypothetical protein
MNYKVVTFCNCLCYWPELAGLPHYFGHVISRKHDIVYHLPFSFDLIFNVTEVPSFQCWDLSLVLRALMEEPFEPMDRASLKNITLNTVFLVALATARRRSELHALSYEKISFNKERGRSNCHPLQASWRRTRRLTVTPLGVQLLSRPCRQQLIELFLTEPYA